MSIQDKSTEVVIGAAIEVHKALGPGLLESAYEECLCHELASRGVAFRRQVPVPLRYKGVSLDCAFRVDLLIEGGPLVEIKAVEQLLSVHKAQLITHLRLTDVSTGLLINFNVASLRQGIRRLKHEKSGGVLRSAEEE